MNFILSIMFLSVIVEGLNRDFFHRLPHIVNDFYMELALKWQILEEKQFNYGKLIQFNLGLLLSLYTGVGINKFVFPPLPLQLFFYSTFDLKYYYMLEIQCFDLHKCSYCFFFFLSMALFDECKGKLC